MPICEDCEKIMTPNGRHTNFRGRFLCGRCYIKAHMRNNGH